MDRITANATACWFDNRNHNRDAAVSTTTTTATAVIFFNNRPYFKKFVFKKKFILPILKFEFLPSCALIRSGFVLQSHVLHLSVVSQTYKMRNFLKNKKEWA